MERRVKVWVQALSGHANLYLQWHEPTTGKRRSKSAGTADRRAAEVLASDLEADLNHGRYADAPRLTWEHFRQLFEAEYVAPLRPNTRTTYQTSLDAFEHICHPGQLAAITERTISAFVAGLRTLPIRSGPLGPPRLSPSPVLSAPRTPFVRILVDLGFSLRMLWCTLVHLSTAIARVRRITPLIPALCAEVADMDANRSIKLQLTALANLSLARLKTPPTATIEVHAEDDSTELLLIAKPIGQEPVLQADVSSSLPLRRFFFSPPEREIVEVVARHPGKADTIAVRLGQTERGGTAPTKLRLLLGNLVSREVLHVGEDGYAISEDFAPLLAILFTSLPTN